MPAAINVIKPKAWDKQNFRDSDSFREYLLSEIRAARVQAQLWQCQLDVVGVGLKAGLITADQAIEELDLKLIARGAE